MVREIRVRTGGAVYTAVLLIERKRAASHIAEKPASVRVRDKAAAPESLDDIPMPRVMKIMMGAAFSLIAVVGLGMIIFYTAFLGSLIWGK